MMRYLILSLLTLALCAPAQAASLFAITPPFKVYPDLNGQPLNNGFLYFGVAGQNPETNPITVYWDVAGTIPAAQPIRTVNGYPARFGTPTNVYTASDTSITVRNSKSVLVVTALNSTDLQLAGAILSQVGASLITIADAGGFYTPPDNVENALQQAAQAATTKVADPGGLYTSSPKTVEKCLQELAGTNRLATTVVQALLPTGAVIDFVGVTAPAGFVSASGRTIGSAASNATERANADTQPLYVALWTDWANAQLPIQDSAGTPTTRGGSAAADFAANKRLPLPDLRSRTTVGRDNMGGSSANVITAAAGNFDTTVQGALGGTQTVTLTTPMLSAHTHTITHSHTATQPAHSHFPPIGGSASIIQWIDTTQAQSGLQGAAGPPFGYNVASAGVLMAANTKTLTEQPAITVSGTDTANSGSQGSGIGHPNVPPAIVVSKIIKLIVPLDYTGAN